MYLNLFHQYLNGGNIHKLIIGCHSAHLKYKIHASLGPYVNF